MNIIRLPAQRVMPAIELLDQVTNRRQQTNPRLVALQKSALAEAVQLLEPVALWTRIEPGYFSSIPGPQKRSFSGIQALLGSICTIGDRLEKRTQQYFSAQETIAGYYLDLVGTLAVAKLAQIAAEDLRGQYAAQHWAPGDDRGDVDLESQRFLFDMLPAGQIGMQLTENNIMRPLKSLSFFLVIGQQISGLRCSKACALCAWNGMCDKRLQQAAQDDIL
jgi:hypothetical protein